MHLRHVSLYTGREAGEDYYVRTLVGGIIC